MNIRDHNLNALTNEQLNFLAAEVRGFPGVGYYGPNKSGDDGATHQDYDRFDTKAEALGRYRKYWTRPADEGFVCGADMDEDDIDICYWKENWGPLTADRPADGDDGLWGSTFEDWFFDKYPTYMIQVKKAKNSVAVSVWEGPIFINEAMGLQESRVRVVAMLKAEQAAAIGVSVEKK